MWFRHDDFPLRPLPWLGKRDRGRHGRSWIGGERLHEGIADTLISVADAFPWPDDFLAQAKNLQTDTKVLWVSGRRRAHPPIVVSGLHLLGANYWGLTWRRKLSRYHLPVPTSIRHVMSVRSSIVKTKNTVFCCHSLRMASTAAIRRSTSSAPSAMIAISGT